MRKKILISAYSLELGGIEKALINLLHQLDLTKYQITLVLEKKKGIFLKQVPRQVKILEYPVCQDKNVLFRKIKNRLHFWKWKKEHKNKYDFAISFATYSRPGALLALTASSNNALWIHNNYEQIYEQDEIKIKQFFEQVSAEKFKYLVFVSYENQEALCKYIPKFRENSLVCNNILDYVTMREQAKEKIKVVKNKVTFLNVGRHEEHQKRLSRIINASKRLVDEGYQFQVWFVGEGKDTKNYQDLVKKNHLEDVILFLGKKENPFPYYRKCDAVLLSSQYEGYPVVFMEARTLHKPVITTKVSDYYEVEDGYGIVVENTDRAIFSGMKLFLDSGYTIKRRFSPEKFNQENLEKIEKLIDGKSIQ